MQKLHFKVESAKIHKVSLGQFNLWQTAVSCHAGAWPAIFHFIHLA